MRFICVNLFYMVAIFLFRVFLCLFPVCQSGNTLVGCARVGLLTHEAQASNAEKAQALQIARTRDAASAVFVYPAKRFKQK